MRATCALALLMTAASAVACPPPSPAVSDIVADSYYRNTPTHSEVDPVRKAQNEAAVKPFEDFLRQVADMASRGGSDDAACAVRWLKAWADGGAMLGNTPMEQGYYERKWTLAGLALSYAKVRGAASSGQSRGIDVWLQRLAGRVIAHSAEYRGTRNNHYYWEGLAVAATGAATGNKADIDWGRKVFADAMAQIAPDGTLPHEMARGQKALHYHLFAAAPLAILSSILDADSPRLDALVQFCIAGLNDPGMVAKRAGAAQGPLLDDDADWLAVYARRHPLAQIDTILRNRRPHVSRLGGALDKPNPLEHPHS
jgi:poly(beta-D-mannuronate) lyase